MQHYANIMLVNDHGNEILVRVYLQADGSMVERATNGLVRERQVPTEAKPFPQYGEWFDPIVDAK